MTEKGDATGDDRKQEERMIKEAKRGPTAVGQGNGDEESGADSARGMQTGAEHDQTRTADQGQHSASGRKTPQRP